MNRRILGLLAVAAMGCSLSANAQLTSADNGAAATDTHGLMWANTVGTNLTWSSTGAAGSAQARGGGPKVNDYVGRQRPVVCEGELAAFASTTTLQTARQTS